MFDNHISTKEQFDEFCRKYERMKTEVSELETEIENAKAEKTRLREITNFISNNERRITTICFVR